MYYECIKIVRLVINSYNLQVVKFEYWLNIYEVILVNGQIVRNCNMFFCSIRFVELE